MAQTVVTKKSEAKNAGGDGVRFEERMRKDAIYRDVRMPCHWESILNEVKRVVSVSDTYMQTKIPMFELGKELYRDYRFDMASGDLKGASVFIVLDAMSSMLMTYARSTQFKSSTNAPLDEEKAEALTKLFSYDWQTAGYEAVENDALTARNLNGAAMVYMQRWNKRLLRPEFVDVPTESMVVDPEGGADVDDHRWIGAAMVYNAANAARDPAFIREAIMGLLAEGAKARGASETEARNDANRRAFAHDTAVDEGGTAGGADTVEEAGARRGKRGSQGGQGAGREEDRRNIGLDNLRVYDVFLPLRDGNGKTEKYLVTVSQSMEWLLRVERLSPVTDEERADPMIVRYPVVLKQNYRTFKSDLIGLSIPAMIGDKHVFRATTMNIAKDILRYNSKQRIVTMGGSMEAESVRGLEDILLEVVPDEFDTTAEKDVRRMVQNLPGQPMNLSEMQVLVNYVQKDIEDITGVNDIALGAPAPSGERLGQTEQRAANISVRTKSRIQKILDEQRRMGGLWVDAYRRHYRGASGIRKKSVSVLSGTTNHSFVVSRRDFEGRIPSVVVKSEIVEREKSREKSEVVGSMLPFIQSTGDAQLFSEAQRNVFEFSGLFEKEEVNSMVSTDPAMAEIEQDITRLRADLDVELLPGVDVRKRMKRMLNIPTEAGRRYANQLLLRAAEEGIEMAQERAAAEEQVVGSGDNAGRVGQRERAGAVQVGR